MSHSLAGIGGGYAWPKLKITGDGITTTLSMFPGSSKWEPIRYLERAEVCLPTITFERTALSFLLKVDSRLQELNVEAPGFFKALARLKEEHEDSEIVQWRKLEALCGYDPDEAPEALIEALHGHAGEYGIAIVDEFAAAFRANALGAFERLDEFKAVGVDVNFPDELRVANLARGRETEAWADGEVAAKRLRENLDLNGSHLDNKKIGEILSVQDDYFHCGPATNLGMSAAFADPSAPAMKLHLDKKWHTGRRFDAARLIGDFQLRTDEETILPATSAFTYRQKYQKAFARELLLPNEMVRDVWKRKGADSEAIEALADDFEVSPRLVESTLVNKGLAERDLLTA